LNDDEKRDVASEYGIVYVYRTNEQKKQEIENLQQSIVFS
jgi:hypothetical protein